MATPQLPDFMTEFGLLINGDEYGLKADEIQFPKHVPIKQDYNAGGLRTALKVDLGQLEPMETSFKIAGLGIAINEAKTLCSSEGFRLIFNGKTKRVGACTQKSVEAVMRGSIKEWNPLADTVKRGEPTENPVAFDITYYEVNIDSKQVYKRDDLNNILRIDDEDVL